MWPAPPCTLHETLLMPKDGLSAVLVKDDGLVCLERVGECDEDMGPDFLVLYQRGLTSGPPVDRCHRSLLSPFKIKSNERYANVPWANFAWLADSRTGRMTKGTCTDCSRDDCMRCFDGLTADNVLVVWIHGTKGQRIYQWYVAFDHKKKVLMRIPGHFVSGIVANSSITGFCKCGRCRHPISEMVNSRTPSRACAFDERAVNYFTKLRALVNHAKTEKAAGEATQSTFVQTGWTHMEEGTCAVCLEDTFVNKESCVRQRCSIKVCTDCHLKTRGMCPICDRAKLGCASSFMCHSCDKGVDLKEYGYGCLKCNNNVLCVRCYKNFGMCVGCECDMSTASLNKRKRDASG